MERKRVTVTHFYDDFRDEISKIFLKLQKKYDLDEEVDFDDCGKEEYEEYEEDLINHFSALRNNNYNHYLLIITLLYHDYILSLQDDTDPLKEVLYEEFEKAREEINDIKSLDEYLQNNTQFYSDIVEGFLNFYEYEYFEKRKTYLKSKKIDKYLFKVFPPHLIDKLYYVITYTEEDLMTYFEEDGMSAIGVIISLLQNLYQADKENFNKLIEPLIYKYYKNFNYKREKNESDECNDELLKLIEDEDTEVIKEKVINNMDYLENILLEFYNNSFVYDEKYKEEVDNNYQKHKVKKLEEMM